MQLKTRVAILCLLAVASSGRLAANHPEIPADGLHCEVFGNSVALRWEFHFLVPIEGYELSRDGALIAELSPDTIAYRDTAVERGEHVYVLNAINRGGERLRLAACEVVVGDFGVRCRVEGNDVDLQWEPLLIDIAFPSFVIRRDGVVVGSVPSDELSFVDEDVEPGDHRYTVHGFVSAGHEFLVGACTVQVRESGFVCRVAPPDVHLDWSAIPVIEIVHHFVIFRNDAPMGRTTGSDFVDQPGPGAHHYEVLFVAGPIPDTNIEDTVIDGREHFKIGECTIVMPGDGPPPPQGLTCVDLDAPPELELDDTQLLRTHDVLLTWRPLVDYDAVFIARDYERVAVLPGNQLGYIDRNVPPGVHVYRVFGILNDQISRPAECEVVIPRPEILPPRDLACRYVGPRVDEPVDGVGAGRIVTPVDTTVVLAWVNGQAYDFIVVVTNNQAIVRLPGSATSFRHADPSPGRNHYQVFGVVGLRRSDSAECLVHVPPVNPPLPVENLRCVVVPPVPQLDPAEPVDPAIAGGEVAPVDPDEVPSVRVLLRWDLPRTATLAAVYDRILVTRDDLLIATLPGDATSHVDQTPVISDGVTYCVVGVVGVRRSEPTCCDVDLGPPVVSPPRDLECRVIESRLTDEELANLDIEPADPAIPVPVVRLSWINPVRYGRVFVARDEDLIASLSGDASTYFDVHPGVGRHVYHVWGTDVNGNASRRVSCDVVIEPRRVPPVRDLTCIGIQEGEGGNGVARLSWVNGADDYDAIQIVRDGDIAFRLPGSATDFLDQDLEPGVHEYDVTAFRDDGASPSEACRVVIDGSPGENRLYFSSGLFSVDPVDDTPARIDPGGRVTCMASNSDPIQGWSFGVCSDPAFLIPAEATIEATTVGDLNDGQGPSFLVINRLERGVTIAAIIDDHDTSDTLPPASRHTLLRLRYDPGPDARTETRYPVRYCDSLGRPPVDVLYVVRGLEVRPTTSRGAVVFNEPPGLFFLRGDANGDGDVGMADAQSILSYLFTGGDEPPCEESADANGSTEINIADGVYLLQWEFLGGPEPPGPFPDCGPGEILIGCEDPTCPQPEL